jgi:alkylation response protein AidB-like acyl-CoA dehydrogenase
MKPNIDEALVAKARELGPLIREHAAEAERVGRVSKPVLRALDETRISKMFLPRTLGGAEADPITVMRAVEEIASHDAAAGWMLMVSNASAWFAGRYPKATAEELFADPYRWLCATAFQPPVEAREVEGGYRLTGQRPFASGAHAARWVTLTAIVMDGAQPRMQGGMPTIVVAVMPIEDVQIVETWDGLGLRGSDSNDVSVRDVFVPTARTAPLSPVFEPNEHYRGPIYRLPALAAIVLATMAPTALAIARRAINEVRALSSKRVPMASMVAIRDRGAAQERLGRAEAILRSARAFAYEAMADVWNAAQAAEPIALELRGQVLLAAAHAAQASAEVTDLMFTSGGSSAVFKRSPLERLFRDMSVIRQHGFVCAGRYETVAQIALGLEPDLPLVHF